MDERIDLEALHYYLSYKYVPSPHTIYRGKHKRPLFDASGLRFSPVHELAEDELVDRLDRLFRRAVEKALPDPPALLLSGGIDSALITAVASDLTEHPIQTFNLAFAPEMETDKKRKDREYASRIASWFHTHHREGVLTLDDFQGKYPAILRAIGEPYACNVSMYFICDFAKAYVDTAVSGDWADELFGSYGDHQRAAQHPEEPPAQIRYAASIFSDEEKQSLYASSVRREAEAFSTREHLAGYFDHLTAKDPVNRMLEGWLRSVFPDNSLMPVIKLSRAHGVEVRSPFGDPELVEFVNRIPGDYKIRDGETKYILKRLALRYLPEEFVFQKKEFFTPPLLTLAQRSEPYIRRQLDPAQLARHGCFDADYVRTLVNDFFNAPSEPLAYKLWTLVAFQIWYDSQAD